MAEQNANTAILFDRDEVEHLGSLSQRPKRLRGSKLLWIDIDRRTQASADEVAAVFDLGETTRRRLGSSEGRAVFVDAGQYIHVTTYSPCNEEGRENELTALECVVGENWVITAHDRPLDVLEEFADRVSGSGDTGSLDGPAFLATLLEWVLGAYSAAFERLEERLEDFDVHAMRGQGADEDIETLVGSFEVLIARTGHRTNHIMKVLTLTSVILLPGALIAGVMGMNFKVRLFEDSWMFYVVLAVILALAPLTVAIAKMRDWI
jgi:Mg2+ and Co2+ transporter CorA